jgi:hypothetical protein
MRRLLLVLFLASLAASSGCLSADDKRQWQEAFGDLRGDNMKTIAPLSPKKSD